MYVYTYICIYTHNFHIELLKRNFICHEHVEYIRVNVTKLK